MIFQSKNKLFYYTALLSLILACKPSDQLRKHDFPKPVDTSNLPITNQLKKTYTINGVTASNEFDAARMNDFIQINDSTFRVTILPENEPINSSPHYAFWLSSDTTRKIDLELFYDEHKHRYYPKLSSDLKSCKAIICSSTRNP